MGHEALVYWHRDQIFPWTFRGPEGHPVEPSLSWRFQFDSYEAITDAAVKGLGVACLPNWLVRDHLLAKRLVPLLEDIASDPFDTYALWPTAQYLPMKLRVAIDALVEKLRWVSDP
jgi:DNA-binding transcriptional LysR family regulator